MAGLFDTRATDWVLLVTVFAGAFVLLLLSDWSGGFFVENGPIEIAQLACLVLAAIFFLRASRGLASWPALTCIALASLCLLALARETPRCSSPLYDFGPCLSSSYKDAVYVVGAAFPLLMLLSNPVLRTFRLNVAAVAALLRFIPHLMPLLLLVPLIGASQIAEAWQLAVGEEILETAAYALLLSFSLRSIAARERYLSSDRRKLTTSPAARRPCR